MPDVLCREHDARAVIHTIFMFGRKAGNELANYLHCLLSMSVIDSPAHSPKQLS